MIVFRPPSASSSHSSSSALPSISISICIIMRSLFPNGRPHFSSLVRCVRFVSTESSLTRSSRFVNLVLALTRCLVKFFIVVFKIIHPLSHLQKSPSQLPHSLNRQVIGFFCLISVAYLDSSKYLQSFPRTRRFSVSWFLVVRRLL